VDHDNEILQRLVRLETKLDLMMHDPTINRRLDNIEANQQWLWRAVVGAFIAAGVAYLMKG
jgi:hypothetical protein